MKGLVGIDSIDGQLLQQRVQPVPLLLIQNISNNTSTIREKEN
jgi:hypothetical protein